MKEPVKFSRYNVVSRIACGGTSEIYKAYLETENGFKKAVAIKRLLPGFCENDEIRDLIIDEANILTHLQSNTIVQVLDFGCEHDVPFIVMEYIDGIDCARLLDHLIAKGIPLKPECALYIIDQVLLALNFAHRCKNERGQTLGVVHRDISPSNILLSWTGEVKVTDFGIARGLHRTRLTEVGRIRGKYSYMSPEQARGESIDERADLFACAIVLYELVTATRLFDAENDLEVIGKVRSLEIPWDVIDLLPSSVGAVLIPAFSERLDERYESASEMLGDVRGAERNTGNVISSIEMSLLLKSEFGFEGECDGQLGFSSLGGTTTPTAVMSGGRRMKRGRFLPVFRVAASIFVLMIFMSFSNGQNQGSINPGSASQVVTDIREEVSIPKVPRKRGAIAISTKPKGAMVKLAVGDDRHSMTSPFALEDLELGDGFSCRVEITKTGYRTIVETFRLSQTEAEFVRSFELEKEGYGSIFVQARPWAIADVSGYASGRETPFRIDGVKPGLYSLSVRYPPENKSLSKGVTVAEGRSVRCLADFTAHTLKCW